MLTIKDLFKINALDGLKLVAGEKGIHNVISLVNIIENPDKFDWLSSNELLLSTGYIFKDNEDLQNRIIKELAEINCSGLVIKMKRYFDHIPENMIRQANTYGLPLIELPFEYTLSKVIAIINEKASGTYDLLNRRTVDLHNTLFRIALEGGGIERISSMLSETIHNPILFFDRDWKLLHYDDLATNDLPLTNFFDLLKNKPIFNQAFIDSIPQHMNQMKKSIKRIYHLDGFEVKCRILPIFVADKLYGYIVVWQTVRELTEFDYIALEQASTIVALEMIKAKEIEEVKLKIRDDFLDDLITGKITISETVENQCNLHGLHTSYLYYCTVIHIESDEGEASEDWVARKNRLEHTARRCVELVYDHASAANGEVTCFYRNNRIIILIGQNEKRLPVSEAKHFANHIYETLGKQIEKASFFIGIGRQHDSIISIHKSYAEANEAIRLMQRFGHKEGMAHFEDHSVYHFLDSNIKEMELEAFFTQSLGKVNEHDKLHGTSYIVTLEHYFFHHLNISETAKALFIHRNTLIYRIEKIKEILNTDLKNSEELLKIQLALKIGRLLQ